MYCVHVGYGTRSRIQKVYESEHNMFLPHSNFAPFGYAKESRISNGEPALPHPFYDEKALFSGRYGLDLYPEMLCNRVRDNLVIQIVFKT